MDYHTRIDGRRMEIPAGRIFGVLPDEATASQMAAGMYPRHATSLMPVLVRRAAGPSEPYWYRAWGVVVDGRVNGGIRLDANGRMRVMRHLSDASCVYLPRELRGAHSHP